MTPPVSSSRDLPQSSPQAFLQRLQLTEVLGGEQEHSLQQILSDMPDLDSHRKVKSALESSVRFIVYHWNNIFL